jgi:ribonuclease HII
MRQMLVCGIDEAGRGPLAGPVCAAAVVLGAEFPAEMLNDSKKLSETARERAAPFIREKARAWGLGWASHTEIDEINILQATLLAMHRAFDSMLKKFWNCAAHEFNAEAGSVIIDGLYTPELPVRCEALVRADAKVPAVMAASILAKTARDNEMRRLALIYPQYKYEKHKGYPTKEHRELIARFGPSPIQRRTFNFSV